MKPTDQLKAEIQELAELYKTCLEIAKENIPRDILCKKGMTSGERDRLMLQPENYQKIASSLFIQVNINGSNNNRGSAPKPDAPSTDNQQQFIRTLLSELSPEEGDAIVNQFLENIDKSEYPLLSKSEATTLISMLKEEKASKKGN